MNSTRASEIASSTEMINVTYNGNLVYIEDVNPNKATASVHYLDRPESHEEVSLTQLVEMRS